MMNFLLPLKLCSANYLKLDTNADQFIGRHKRKPDCECEHFGFIVRSPCASTSLPNEQTHRLFPNLHVWKFNESTTQLLHKKQKKVTQYALELSEITSKSATSSSFVYAISLWNDYVSTSKECRNNFLFSELESLCVEVNVWVRS